MRLSSALKLFSIHIKNKIDHVSKTILKIRANFFPEVQSLINYNILYIGRPSLSIFLYFEPPMSAL